MIKLTREQTEAATNSPSGVPCQGDGTNKVFVIVDAELHRQMYRKDVIESVNRAVSQAESGEGLPLDEADQVMRQRLGFPPPTT